MPIDPSNVDAARYLTSILSLISFVFSFFFIFIYLFRKGAEKFYLKLVFYLQISDAIQSLGLFFSVFDPEDGSPFCNLQAFLIEFGSISSILWRSAISVIMYISIKINAETAEAQEIRILLLLFWISILISIIPFCANAYGRAPVWCWFKEKGVSPSNQQLLHYLLFYMELWIAMLIILVITVLVANHLKSEARKSSLAKFRRKLKYYPLAVIAIWLIPSIDRIWDSVSPDATNEAKQVFIYFHIIALCLQGFTNFFLYGYGYVKKLFRKGKQPRISQTPLQNEANSRTRLLTCDKEEPKSMEIADESPNLTDN